MKKKTSWLLKDLRNHNEIFMKDVSYHNIKSHKKPGLHRSYEKQIFGKATVGGQIDAPIPSHFRVKTRLIMTIKKLITFYKLRFIFQTSNRFKNYFCFKRIFPKTWRSSFVFKIFFLVWEFCQKGQFPHIFGR